MARKDTRYEHLPRIAADYIRATVKKVRYSRRVRREVAQELIDHFTDSLHGCDGDEKDRRASELVEQFGDPKTLARLIRRGKKRCRPLWKKTLVRSLQGFALIVVFCCLYTAWLATGTATISVD